VPGERWAPGRGAQSCGQRGYKITPSLALWGLIAYPGFLGHPGLVSIRAGYAAGCEQKEKPELRYLLRNYASQAVLFLCSVRVAQLVEIEVCTFCFAARNSRVDSA
jgi:hypothetical protein